MAQKEERERIQPGQLLSMHIAGSAPASVTVQLALLIAVTRRPALDAGHRNHFDSGFSHQDHNDFGHTDHGDGTHIDAYGDDGGPHFGRVGLWSSTVRPPPPHDRRPHTLIVGFNNWPVQVECDSEWLASEVRRRLDPPASRGWIVSRAARHFVQRIASARYHEIVTRSSPPLTPCTCVTLVAPGAVNDEPPRPPPPPAARFPPPPPPPPKWPPPPPPMTPPG